MTIVNPGKVVSNVVFFTVRKPSKSIAMAGKQVFENCSAVAVGDFNNDGILDVAWVSPGSLNVSLVTGKGVSSHQYQPQ